MLLALVLEGGMVKMLNCLGRPRDGGLERFAVISAVVLLL
jgi:hypothetical protein